MRQIDNKPDASTTGAQLNSRRSLSLRFIIIYISSMFLVFVPGLGSLCYLCLLYCFPDATLPDRPMRYVAVVGLAFWLLVHASLGALWGRIAPRKWALTAILPVLGPLSVSLAMVQKGLIGAANLSPTRALILMMLCGGIALFAASASASKVRPV